MPNWCYSNIDIKDSPEKLDLIEKEMRKALSSNPLGADFGNEWLGNLLHHIGVEEKEILYGEIRCRGSIIEMDRTANDILHLDTESAWGPHITCIQMFANHYSLTAEITYVAEECGCGLFWTNDPDYLDRVWVDYCFDLEREDEFPELLKDILDADPVSDWPKDEIRAILINAYGPGEFKGLIRQAEEDVDESGNALSIHEYEFVDIGEDT